MNIFGKSALIALSLLALAATGCGDKESAEKPKPATAEARPSPQLPPGAKRELPRLKSAAEAENDPAAGAHGEDDGHGHAAAPEPTDEPPQPPPQQQPEGDWRSSSKGLQVAQSIIERLDTDGSGTLSREEVAKTPGGPRMPLANFESVDSNRDGAVSPDELMAALGRTGAVPQ